MAKTRRSWTPAQKAEVVEYSRVHGPVKAQEKYGISSSSQMNRWRRELAVPRLVRKKKWTDEKVKEVLAFMETHTNRETMEHFKVGSGQLYGWKHAFSGQQLYAMRKASKLAAKGNGAAVEVDRGDPKEWQNMVKRALLHLERWKNQQRAHIRRGGVDQAYDLEAEHAYRVLRGEE